MPSNIEIKAHVTDIDAMKQKATELSNSTGSLLVQQDTFFTVPNGRLKLRTIQGEKYSQLIYYERSDVAGPKCSQFKVTPVENAQELLDTLTAALGVDGVVKKQRWLYMVGQTRVHIDQVEGLGNFMELEVQMEEGQRMSDGEAIAVELQSKLGVKTEDLLCGAYNDMLKKQK